MRAYLIDVGVVERALEAIRNSMTELELLQNDEDWFVSDSLDELYTAYEEIEANVNNLMELDHEQ